MASFLAFVHGNPGGVWCGPGDLLGGLSLRFPGTLERGRIKGKRSKIRFVPVNAAAQRMIEDYLALTEHRSDVDAALFRPVTNNRTGRLDRHLDPALVYQNIVRKHGMETGLSAERLTAAPWPRWPASPRLQKIVLAFCQFS